MAVILNNLPFLIIGQFPNGPIGGLILTFWLAGLIGTFSFFTGLIFAGVEFVGMAPVRWVARGVSMLIRGVPSVAFLFWIYFLLPRLIHVDPPPIIDASIALSLYHGAYMGEDFRGGLKSVNSGQWAASRALGLGTFATLRLVVLPQAIRAVLPALVNRFVNLFMYTSVVSMVGIIEFTRCAILVNNRELIYPIQIFGFAGLVYFVACYGMSWAGRKLEKKWTWAPKVRMSQTAA